MKQRNAFTLLELSLVLVLIGFFTGTIMLAADFIALARIRSDISLISNLNVAVNSFKGLYGEYPGDFKEAGRLFSLPAFRSGDGDGKIEQNTGGNPNPDRMDHPNAGTGLLNEIPMVFLHLSKAKLLSPDYPFIEKTKPGENIPKLKSSDGGLFLFTDKDDGITYFFIGVRDSATNPFDADQAVIFYNGVFTPENAYNIDRKLDDGKVNSGSIKALHTPWLTYMDMPNYGCMDESNIDLYNIGFQGNIDPNMGGIYIHRTHIGREVCSLRIKLN